MDMLELALGYTSEDQQLAQRIATDLAGRAGFEHFAVGRANEGPVLADLVDDSDKPLLLLISHKFLTNPNGMLRLERVLNGGLDVLCVVIDANLETDSDAMFYISHWQDRYIDLRRSAEEMRREAGPGFDAYLKKIRETSIEAELVLRQLQRTEVMVSNEQLEERHYRALFEWLGIDPAEQPAEEAPDLSNIPGISLLDIEDEMRNEQEALMTEPDAPVMNTEAPVAEAPEPAGEDPMAPEEQSAIWIERGWVLFDRGETEQALDLLAGGIEALPEAYNLRYQRALMLGAAVRPEEARRELTGLLEKHPAHTNGLYLSGELYEVEGRYSEARDEWELLMDHEPTFQDLDYRLGSLIADHFAEDYLDAATYLKRAVKRDPDNAEAAYQYALLLGGPLERTKKAIKVLRRAVSRNPEHAFARYQLAVLLHQVGKQEEARTQFKMATALNPAFATDRNRRAFAEPTEATDKLSAIKQNLAELEEMMAQRAETEAREKAAARVGEGRTVLITGATSGIGRAAARRLAADGFRLILLGRRTERLEKLRQELAETQRIESLVLSADVRDRTAVETVLAGRPEEWMTVDFLINNAGKAKGAEPIHEGRIEHWEEMIDVNLKGLLYLTRAIVPAMVERGSGMVVNVASTAGKEVYPGGNVYCATKHAVDALTYAMRLDLVKHGIRVGQICPAMVEETEFSLVRFDGDAERAKIYEDFQPLRSPDVAEAIRFMITQPAHVNVLDMVLQGTQQASSTVVDRSGRAKYAEEE